ncbi:MAG: hypothetical protein ACI4RA_06295, partial [Kiritimatiellia bacterium]
TGGVCRCGTGNQPPGDDPAPPPPDPMAGGLSIEFSKGAVVFEEAYTNSPGVVVSRQSTTTRLTVSASGGVNGGTFTLTSRNLGKLTPVDGSGPISLTSGMRLGPGQTYFATFLCAGMEESGGEDDIRVEGTYIEENTGLHDSPAAATTVVVVEVEPVVNTGFANRHLVGVREECLLRWRPASAQVRIRAGEDGIVDESPNNMRYQAPLEGGSASLSFQCRGASLDIVFSVVEPRAVFVGMPPTCKPPTCNEFGLPRNAAGGIGMNLELYIMPTNVSFNGIAVQEIPTSYRDPKGYFAHPCFQNVWSHTEDRGAGKWHDIAADNFFMYDGANMGDELPRMTPDGVVTDDPACGWANGTMSWKIPVGWNERGSTEDDLVIKSFQTYWQQFAVNARGTLRVTKLGHWVQRGTNAVISIDGEVQWP